MSKNVSIAIGVLFTLSALGGIIRIFEEGVQVANIIAIIITGLLGYWFLYVKGINRPATVPAPKQQVQKETAVPKRKTTPAKTIDTMVVGLSYDNEDGRSRQDIIREYVEEQIESGMEEAYNGQTDEEILSKDYNSREYEVTITGDMDLELEAEPDNQYDPNAVKVFLDGEAIGYIPKEDAKRVKKLIEKEDYFYEFKILGGRYKEVRDGEVIERDSDYKIFLKLYE